ncbi:hypothetical protein ACOME3_007940 [Neoechinorhynchus agilis]
MRWCPDKQEFYLPCEIVSIKGNEATVKLITKNEKRTVQANLLEEMNPPRYENSEDMADLTHLNDASVLHNLRSRYSLNLIYTYSGLFCVTVNPYQNLPIYGFDVMTAYREAARSSRPPHIYAVTDNTYTSMLREKENQSILITGESGSGKTENTKKVIQYFAFVGSVADSAQNPKTLENNLENQIISANPLLESYGNAKTIRNDNSSRFGKFIQIHFNSSGKIAGANISTYLLEKSRVTYQNPRERNYHIFYQLLSGAIPELQEQILIGRDVSSYVYVNRGSGKADTINDSQDMINTDKAIDVLGFSAGEKASIYRITAAVLIFGNAKWKQRNREEQAECDGTAECEKVAYLLEIDVHELMKCLLRPRIKVGSEYVNRGQSKVQVTNTVAALSKSIYERLFNWIVTKVNDKLAASSKRKHFIGVLDIAGFEIFEPMGIFSILEEECIIPKGNDAGFVTKLLEKYAGKHPNLSKHKSGKSEIKADFDIHHYAGIVAYTVFEWLDKNKDPANVSVAGLFKNSKNQLMATLFEDMGDEEIGRTGRVKKTGSMRTISAIHKEQLNCLIKTLTATHPHFVRCILPNEEKKAGLFNVRLVIQQLHCNGVLEGIRICRKGYPNRMPFSEFKRCYSILAGNDIPKGYVDSRKVAEIVLQARAISQDSYKLGQTKVFFKVGVLATLESLRERALSIIITNLQARIRSYLSLATYHHMRSRRKAIEILQKNGRTYLGFRNWKWWSLYTKLKPLLTVARQEEEMCRLKQEFDKAQVTIEAETAKRAVLECQSASLMKENDDLKSHLDLNKALLDAAEHKAETMIEKQKELESELDDLSETISSQEDTINMLRGRLRSTDEDTRKQQNEILKLNSSIASYETQLNASKSERDDLEEKVKKLMAQVQKQAKELEKKQKDLAVLGDQNGELNDKNKKLTKLKAKLESSVNTLESSVQDLTKSLNDLRRQNTSDAAEIARLKGLLNTLEGESKKLRNEIDEKVDLMACLNNQLNEEMIKGEKFHDINKKLKGENNELRNELENLQSSKYQVEVESVAKDDQIAILEEELANKTHIAKHDAETSRMREKELDKLKIELEQVKAKNEKNEVEFKRRYEALKIIFLLELLTEINA